MMAPKNNNSGRIRKVWHITDFRELFELPDDLRKDRPGPLSYTKSFVTLTGFSKGHEIAHFERMEELKSRAERHLLRSVFEDLKNWSGKKTIEHRGYLLTTAGQPATYDYLSAQLKVSVEELKQAMQILAEIGLIDRMPIGELLRGEMPVKYETRRRRSKITRNGAKPRSKRKSGTKTTRTLAASGSVRTNPDGVGKKRTAFKNGKGKSNEKANGNGKGVNENKNGNGNTERAKINGKGECKGDSNVPEGNGEQQSEPAATKCRQTGLAPATAPPFVPQVSDARGSRVIPFAQAPSGSVHYDRAGPQHIGTILDGMSHRYDQDAQQFAYEIYRALTLPWAVDSPQAAREIGCFAKQWQEAVKAGLSPPDLSDLRVRALAEASKIAKRRQNRNKAAVWVDLFKRLAGSRIPKAM